MLGSLTRRDRSGSLRRRGLLWCLGLGWVLSAAVWLGCDPAGDSRPEPAEKAAEEPEATGDDPFLDVTDRVGLDFRHFNGMSGEYYYSEMMGSGAALFDADNDGDLDLFLVQGNMLGDKPLSAATLPPGDGPHALSDRLYLNDLVMSLGSDPAASTGPDDPPFRFRDVTAVSGVDGPGDGYGMGALAADFDGDGWTDLYVTQTGANRLLQNRGLDPEGHPTFEDVTDDITGSTRWGVPAVAFDADGDGDTDLFIGNYVRHSIAVDKNCPDELGQDNYCGPLAYPPQPDQLLINVTEPGGPLRFEDRSGVAGIEQEFGACLGVVAADFNADGALDIYVANDASPNQLWINRGDGRFENQALLAGAGVNGLGHAEASMGVVAVDVDGDADEDIFLTHLARETHTLYANDGRGGFVDRSAESGLAGPSLDRTGFGTAIFDYDHDGLLDAVVAAGAVKIVKEQSLAGDPHPLHQKNQLYRGVAPGRFEDVTESVGAVFRMSEVSRSAAVGDLDNDGDLDLVITNNGGPARILLNRVGQNSPWLGLRLVSGSGTDVPGAAAEVIFADGGKVLARVGANAGYASSGDPRLTIPLARSGEPVAVEAIWPGGRREKWSSVPVGAYTTLKEGAGRPVSEP